MHNRRKPWDKTDLAYLRRHYGRQKMAAIAARLGRTRDGVHHRARKLGLKTQRLYAPGQVEFIRRNYGKLRGDAAYSEE